MSLLTRDQSHIFLLFYMSLYFFLSYYFFLISMLLSTWKSGSALFLSKTTLAYTVFNFINTNILTWSK